MEKLLKLLGVWSWDTIHVHVCLEKGDLLCIAGEETTLISKRSVEDRFELGVRNSFGLFVIVGLHVFHFCISFVLFCSFLNKGFGAILKTFATHAETGIR